GFVVGGGYRANGFRDRPDGDRGARSRHDGRTVEGRGGSRRTIRAGTPVSSPDQTWQRCGRGPLENTMTQGDAGNAVLEPKMMYGGAFHAAIGGEVFSSTNPANSS